MRASDFGKSRYFNASDFGDQPENWIIAAVAAEVIGRDDPAEKPVLELVDVHGKPADRRLVLNKSNLLALANGFGDEMEAWIGRPILVQSKPISFRGEHVHGISVAPGAVAINARQKQSSR